MTKLAYVYEIIINDWESQCLTQFWVNGEGIGWAITVVFGRTSSCLIAPTFPEQTRCVGLDEQPKSLATIKSKTQIGLKPEEGGVISRELKTCLDILHVAKRKMIDKKKDEIDKKVLIEFKMKFKFLGGFALDPFSGLTK